MRFDRLWRYGGATAAAFLDGADVMLNPNGASFPINTLLPTITTIHDLTPMVMPCFPRRTAFFLKFLLARSAKSSAAIITVSENSRQDIIRICGVPESKVHVVYEGYDRASLQCCSHLNQYCFSNCLLLGHQPAVHSSSRSNSATKKSSSAHRRLPSHARQKPTTRLRLGTGRSSRMAA